MEDKTGNGMKNVAIIRTLASVSKKQSMAIVRFIKGKKVDDAVELLNNVVKKKIAIPMKGEIPHRKGMASGRYPVKASAVFIKLLKSVAANASQKAIEGNLVISGKVNTAPKTLRPRRFRHHFKRAYIELRLEKK
jgi:ribosomal protein L22